MLKFVEYQTSGFVITVTTHLLLQSKLLSLAFPPNRNICLMLMFFFIFLREVGGRDVVVCVE